MEGWTPVGSPDGVRDSGAEGTPFEIVNGRCCGAARRGDVVAELGNVLTRLDRKEAGPKQRVHDLYPSGGSVGCRMWGSGHGVEGLRG